VSGFADYERYDALGLSGCQQGRAHGRMRSMPSGRCGPGWNSPPRSRRLETRRKELLAVRIGIATGLVVVGDLVGEGSSSEPLPRRNLDLSRRLGVCSALRGPRASGLKLGTLVWQFCSRAVW
jgi:hypothetical protein